METLEKGFENWGVPLFLAGATLLFCAVPYLAFQSLEFTSDGLHIYSSLRNTLKGYGFFFEGPTIEYFMGTHAFLSLVILLPLLKLIDSPLVLAYLTPACHLLGTWLFYRILVFLNKEHLESKSFITALAILYFFYPSAISMMGTYYMFFPDLLLEPFLLLALSSLLKEKWGRAAFWGALIILLKEEFIPLFPLLFIFFAVFIFQKDKSKPRSFWIRLFLGAVLIWLVCSVISIGVMKYYRGLNSFGFGTRSLEIGVSSLSEALKSVWFLIKPVFFVLAFATWKRVKGYRTALFWVTVFVLYRSAISVLAYQKIPTYFWGNTFLVPGLYLALGLFLGPGVAQLSLRDRRLLCVLTVGTVFLCFPEIRHTGTYGIVANTVRYRKPWNVSKAKELQQIRSRMSKPEGYEYFIGPEYTFGPFMERSHLSLSFLMSDGDIKDVSRRDSLIQNAQYVILPTGKDKEKHYRLPEAESVVEKNFSLLWEGNEYRLFGKGPKNEGKS